MSQNKKLDVFRCANPLLSHTPIVYDLVGCIWVAADKYRLGYTFAYWQTQSRIKNPWSGFRALWSSITLDNYKATERFVEFSIFLLCVRFCSMINYIIISEPQNKLTIIILAKSRLELRSRNTYVLV